MIISLVSNLFQMKLYKLNICIIKSYTIIQVVAWAELNSLCSRADWLPEFLPVLGSLPSRENPRVARGEAESLKGDLATVENVAKGTRKFVCFFLPTIAVKQK